MQVEYHVVSQGWRLGPQPTDTIYLGPDPEEWSVTEVAAPHRAFAVPFDIDPQHLRCWECAVGQRIVVRDGETIRDDQGLHRISCAKVKTFKGETSTRGCWMPPASHLGHADFGVISVVGSAYTGDPAQRYQCLCCGRLPPRVFQQALSLRPLQGSHRKVKRQLQIPQRRSGSFPAGVAADRAAALLPAALAFDLVGGRAVLGHPPGHAHPPAVPAEELPIS